MIKLINNSERKIDLTHDLSIPAHKSFEGELEITPRIYQMIQMGVLTKVEADNKQNESNDDIYLTNGAKRRKIIMDNIQAGYVKPSIPLDFKYLESKSSTKRGKKRK